MGDAVYGSDRRLRRFLEQHERPFVLAVRSNETLWSVLAGRLGRHTAAALAAALPAAAWHRLSAGAGAEGERLYDWARVRLARRQAPPWDHWLLIRRGHSKPEDCTYYAVFAPAETTRAALARVAGRRWTIEECFEAGKQEVGLGDYEIRSWQGWYRHITLALLALAFLAALRAKLNRATAVPDKRSYEATDDRAPVGFGVQHPTQETANGDLVPRPAGRRRRACHDVCRIGTEQVDLAGSPPFAGRRQGQPVSVCRW